MNSASLIVLSVMMCMGVTLAAFGGYGSSGYGAGGYGSGGVSYMPVSGGYGGGSAGLDGSFLYLIGFLFLFLILFQGNLFNFTSNSGSTTTPIKIIQG